MQIRQNAWSKRPPRNLSTIHNASGINITFGLLLHRYGLLLLHLLLWTALEKSIWYRKQNVIQTSLAENFSAAYTFKVVLSGLALLIIWQSLLSCRKRLKSAPSSILLKQKREYFSINMCFLILFVLHSSFFPISFINHPSCCYKNSKSASSADLYSTIVAPTLNSNPDMDKHQGPATFFFHRVCFKIFHLRFLRDRNQVQFRKAWSFDIPRLPWSYLDTACKK